MSTPPESSVPANLEAFLSGAYRRILRVAVIFSVAGTPIALAVFGWRSGLGFALGTLLALLNFVWLHHGAELMIRRMVAPGAAPPRWRLSLAFTGRYIFVITAAYVILKGYPSMLGGFVVGLACPILAAMCEGVYEAFAGNKNQTPG